MRERPGRRRSSIGLMPMCRPSGRSVARRTFWCRTTPRPRSSRPVSMTLWSIAPMPTWRRITTPPFCRRGRGVRETKPKSSRRCSSSRDGFSGGCAIEHSTVSPRSNAAIGELLKLLNEERPIRRLGVTRRQLLEEVDRPALKPLPVEPYVFCEWRACRIGIDYHVEADAHYYSVPHRFARADVDVRLTARTVEVFLKGDRIAAHMRMRGNRKHTTVAEHMPSSHRRYKDWTIDRIRADARLIGPATAALCELILEQRPHPEQGFRACLGIVRLAGPYGVERVEAAAERAIEIGARTYGSVRSILDNKLDRRPTQKRATDGTPILHANIRGPRYYN